MGNSFAKQDLAIFLPGLYKYFFKIKGLIYMYSQHPEICLREDVISTINILKRIRKKYDNSSSRQFFEKVKNIKDYNESGLEQAIELLYKEMPDAMLKIDKQYIQLVKNNSVQIYKLFLKESVLSNQLTHTTPFTTSTDLETIISHESAVMYKKEAFIMAVNFLYAGIFMNDEGELYKSYVYLTSRIENLHTISKIAMLNVIGSIAVAIVIKFINNFLLKPKNVNMLPIIPKITSAAILFSMVSLFFTSLYEMWIMFFKRKKVKQTFNVL